MGYTPLNDAAYGKLETVEDITAKPTLIDEHREQLQEELGAVARQLGRYEGSNALEGFLVEFIQVAQTGHLSGSAGTEGDSLRPELGRAKEVDKLCNCGLATCPVNNGDLPPQLRHHGSGRYTDHRNPEVELSDFLREHPQAVVLREAKHVWDEWAGSLRRRINRLHACALKAEEIAEEDPEDPDPIPV